MDAAEAKVRCLELAATISKGITTDPDAIVKTASVLYDFVNSPQQGATPVVPADKPVKAKSVKTPAVLE